jgi:hypothetical protein
MTILNRENDGLYPILLTLTSTVAREKKISRDDLLKICAPFSHREQDDERQKKLSSRASATLLRWTTLGLFLEEGGEIRLATEPKRGESLESFTDRLPPICRRLALSENRGYPLWPEGDEATEEGTGLTADLCRGLAWCLCQDIYTLPTSYRELDPLISAQVKPGKFMVMNDTRWQGLQDWARFLGFATGSGSKLFFDPTAAVRSELKEILNQGEQMAANEFVLKLGERLPVLDTGSYRLKIEEQLKPERWEPPSSGNLSTALSFALRRLQTQGIIRLDSLADANSSMVLTRQGNQTWTSFTHVRLLEQLP